MSDDNEKEPLHKNFFVRVGFVAVCFIVLYYVVSPYQNCVRAYDVGMCMATPDLKTSW